MKKTIMTTTIKQETNSSGFLSLEGQRPIYSRTFKVSLYGDTDSVTWLDRQRMG